MSIALIVSIDRNGAIGRRTTLPWTMPSCANRIKELTQGKPVIMGRRVFESGKQSDLGTHCTLIVVTQEASTNRTKYTKTGAFPAANLNDAVSVARYFATITGAREICIVGGASLFRQTIVICERVYVMRVSAATIDSDVHLQELNAIIEECQHGTCKKWSLQETGKVVAQQSSNADQHDASFITLTRMRSSEAV